MYMASIDKPENGGFQIKIVCPDFVPFSGICCTPDSTVVSFPVCARISHVASPKCLRFRLMLLSMCNGE